MTFSSLSFLFVFFPVTFIFYALCRNTKTRNIVLAAASIVFYAFGEPVAVFIMLNSVLCNYILGILAAGRNKQQNKIFVGIAAVINIGLLICYKYTGFFASILQDMTGFEIQVPDIRLPIGISFFTFQGLSYVIDVYRDRRRVQINFLNVLLYISFFPQLIAGPVVRYGDIAEQIHSREFSADRVSRGIRRFIFGLGKKVLIANQMGFVADAVFSHSADSLGTMPAWAGAVCYTLQIFFDFSGYSDMAIGLGCIFGFDFKENFNYPYVSSSIQDFWRRWHISLTSWFREYVYIPLGGNRRGMFRTDLNRFIVFFLTGLWHGANFTFIVWGMIHGVCQFLENHEIIPVKKKWFKPFGHVYVMLVTIAAFVIFRADTLSQGLGIIGRMFTISSGELLISTEISALFSPLFVTVLVAALVLCTPVCRIIESRCTQAGYEKPCLIAETACSAVVYLLCILSLSSGSYNPFIYFRF
ncbi:MAG: MBOAT family protein [Oscillospiraceae bacterium]|nr:MBOAT family protein [Oscillospiraceae bacterium]